MLCAAGREGRGVDHRVRWCARRYNRNAVLKITKSAFAGWKTTCGVTEVLAHNRIPVVTLGIHRCGRRSRGVRAASAAIKPAS